MKSREMNMTSIASATAALLFHPTCGVVDGRSAAHRRFTAIRAARQWMAGGFALFAAATAMLWSDGAQAQSFGSCTSTMYLGVDVPTQLHRIDTSTNPFTYPTIGSAYSPGYNAMGYDPASNYIFAARWDAATSLYRLLRIGSNGAVQDMGSITGGGINADAGIASGDVGADGFYYVKSNDSTSQIWRVNLTTRAATLITLSRAIASADLAWSNGFLYAHDHLTGDLNRINPNTGVVTRVGASGIVGAADAFGSLMGASNGIFGRRNTGGFYKFDLTTGQATLISNAPAGGGDGAKCATTPTEFAVDLAVTKTDNATTYVPGFDVTYTIVVRNNGPFGVQNAQVSDPLPSSITSASWICGSATGGGVCDAASGTGAINTTADLPAGASVTYTLSLNVPSNYAGSLTNTATVTAPSGSPDTNTTNNSASDTNTMEPPPTSTACSPRLVTAGNTFTLAPLPIAGTVTKTGAPNGWQAANPWATQGGNYTFRWSFSQPVPANWIRFAVIDVNSPSSASFTITLGSGSTATAADFALAPGPTSHLLWNASTGVLRWNTAGPVRQHGFLQGTSADTVTSITITSSNVASGDFIANQLSVRAPCLTVAKTSNPGTGSFDVQMTNVAQANGTAVTSTTLTTTQANTPVSSPMYFAPTPGSNITLTEIVPAGWQLVAGSCTDQNAGVTGNPTRVDTFATPTITIPGANVRPEADIRCQLTNEQILDLAIAKDDGSSTYTPGNNVTYQIVVSNPGAVAVQNAIVADSLPTGISSATWTCGNAVGGGICDAASGSGAINTTADLPVGASLTYSLTMFVPSTFSGSLTNTATVTAPAGTTDANTANNTAADTDTQFPVPPANVADISCRSDASLFNTAYDGAGGRLTSGADNHWQVALTSTPVTGAPPAGLTYNAAAVLTNPPSNYETSPYNNANWISHAADAIHPTSANYDIFYRFQFNLLPGTDPATFDPRLDFYSDNAVYEIWVNGVAQGIRSNYGAADPYFYAGFVAGSQASGTLTGPWSSGFNEIVVHIKSGPGAQAFLAQLVLPQTICDPATVTLNKTTTFVAGGAFGFGLTNTAQATGTVTTSAANTPAQVDGDSSSVGTVEPFVVSTFGADVVITENALPNGWLLSDAVCTSGGTPVGGRSGSAYTIPGSAIDANAESFVCTFTNTPTVNLRLDKSVDRPTARTGETVTYAIRVDNDGPGPGDGARVTDPPVPGVDCSAATLTCNAGNGAACPTTLDVATLQGVGLTIPTLPVGGWLQFGMACPVTATGQTP